MKPLLTLVLSVFISACATSTNINPYQPSHSGSPGYFETVNAKGQKEVTFVGSPSMDLDEVKSHVLRRSAELTLLDQASWFVVVDTYTENNTTIRERELQPITHFDNNYQLSRCNPLGCHHYYIHHNSFGHDLHGATRIQTSVSHTVRLTIETGSGQAPEDSYDAKAIVDLVTELTELKPAK